MARELVVSDDYNRANGGVGANYLRLLPGIGGEMMITSNQTHGNDAASGNARPAAKWIGAGTINNNQYASIEVSALTDNGANFFIGVICRASSDTDAARDFYAAFVASLGTGPTWPVSLIKVVNGTTAILNSASVAWSVNDRIELEAEGTTLRVCKNGTPLGGSFTQTDSDLSTGGVGITGTHSSCPGDNFQAGNITADPVSVALEESGYYPTEPQTNPTIVSTW